VALLRALDEVERKRNGSIVEAVDRKWEGATAYTLASTVTVPLYAES
jgi:hypothetical protein